MDILGFIDYTFYIAKDDRILNIEIATMSSNDEAAIIVTGIPFAYPYP